jgi:hypothetical protein
MLAVNSSTSLVGKNKQASVQLMDINSGVHLTELKCHTQLSTSAVSGLEAARTLN